MKRRSFLRKIALWLSAIAGGVAVISLLRQFYPPYFIRKQKVKIGKAFEYPVDTYTFIENYNLYIYRDYEGVKVVSAVCTHLGCILEMKTDRFECPCHGSVFSEEGKVLSGPAPTNLKWYSLHTSYDGKLVVDLNDTVDPEYKYRMG